MNPDPNAEFDHATLDKIEASPIGALPATPAYQDSLRRLYAAQQVYPNADHKGGHVTARSLTQLPSFYANNLEAFIAGEIKDDALESNASIYERYMQSLGIDLRAKAEAQRLMVIGKAIHHRTKHGAEAVHDPLHTLFLVPGAGPHPGLPGNYLYGWVMPAAGSHLPQASALTPAAWVVNVHDRDDGASLFSTPQLPEALAKLQEVLSSAPFHLNELDGLGFHLT